MARGPKRKKGAVRGAVRHRKPGTGSRQPMSGYGAARRNPGKAAAQGATNFSPEPSRIGRDAYVEPTIKNPGGSVTIYPSISTSEHFEYGREGDPGRGTQIGATGHRGDRAYRRARAAQRRRERDARNRGAYYAGDLRRRAR